MKSYIRFLALVAALCVVGVANALPTRFHHTTTTVTGKWETLTNTTDLLGSGSFDGRASAVLNIGFAFPFGKTVYTQYSVNSDGNLRFGPTVTGTSYYTDPFDSINSIMNGPKINFFGCDGYHVESLHYVRAQNFVTNDGSGQKLVVEFCLGTYANATRNEQYKWQVHLYGNGNIEVVYPSTVPTQGPAVTHQQGLFYDDPCCLTINQYNGYASNSDTSNWTMQWPAGTWPAANTCYLLERIYDYVISPNTSWRTCTDTIAFDPDNAKWYYMSLQEGKQYVFKTGCGAGATADFDTQLELYDVDWFYVGNLLASNDDGCEGDFTSKLEYTATKTGVAFLKVTGYGSNTGSYTLAYRKLVPSAITVAANPAAGGTVSGGGTFYQGDNCTVTATPASSYMFTNWTEGSTVVSTNATYTFNVTSDRTLTANFNLCTQIPNYDVTIIPTTNWNTHSSSISASNCFKKIYKISMMSGVTYTFKTGCGNAATADFDTKLTLYNSSGTQLAANDDDSECGSDLSRIVYTATTSGNVYLEVSGYDNAVGSYTLAYKKECPTGNTDYDYSRIVYTSWSTHSGSTTGTCDGKIYRFLLVNDATYTFKTGCDDGATADFDTYLYLYNSDGTVVASNDDYSSCGSGLSRIVYSPSTSGYYYLRVTGYSGATGSYTLAYKKECVEIPNYHYTITPNTSWNTHSGSTENTCNGKKIYRVYVTAGQKYTFKTGCEDGATANFDTYLEVVDSSSTQLAYNDDNSTCGNNLSLVQYTPTRTGYLFLIVGGFGSYTGNYTLAYRKQLPYTITVAAYPTAGGTVSGGGTHYGGNTCTVSAIPASGYVFTNWTVGSTVVSTSATYTFNVSSDRNLTANFVRQYTIAASANPTEGGTVTGGGTFNSGSTCTLVATPASGYVFTNWTSGNTVVSTSATYTFNVTSARTLTANFEVLPCEDITAADLPYTENFDGYTTSTTPKTGYVLPCWTLAHQYVTMTDEYKPMVYYGSANAHSGSYSLLLNKRCIYAMPKYEGSVNTLQLQFYLTQSQTKYQLEVGVMTNLGSASTFVPVATLNNSGTDPVLRTVDFSTYTGSGHYIAFRNILPSGTTGDYSCNFLDDITLTLNTSACSIAVTDLPYTENFDSYTTSTTPKTGVAPQCWTLAHQYVTMTDEYKPMVYYGSANAHSESYSLLLNKRCIYAMPKYEGDVNTLQLQFYLTQSQTKYQLEVGVMSNLSDASTFLPVATLNNSGTAPVLRTVDFSGYTGSGHYIAFRNVLPSGTTGDYSCNFLDDITLTLNASACAIAVTDLPYTENFDSYTTSTTPKTGVAPQCWTLAHQYVTMTDEYKPMVYYGSANAHSESYSLLLNKRCIYAMPKYEGDVNTLQLQFYLTQSQTKYQLEVGVMSNLSDASTFLPVATLNNSGTAPVLRTVDFSTYTGSGHYIAFRNVLPSGTTGDYSCNFLDDITLTLNASACAIAVTDLPYTENFDSYTTSTTPKTGYVLPCWTLAHQYVTMTDEYKPMVYYGGDNAHSGNYSLLLNKRCIYAMPKYEGDVSTLQLQFYLTQSQTKYQLQVGVMSNLSDASTFVPVATLNNSGTGPVLRTVNFSGYTGSGHYIAFRNILPSGTTGDYSCNFLDDITLTLNASACAIAVTDLPYTENFDSYTTSTTPKTGYVLPCWTLAHQYVTMTDEYKPMVYYGSANAHSGSYSLLLNKRCIYAMPKYEGSVNTLQLQFYLTQSQTKYQLQVGVMSNLSDASTFVPVATLNNSGTGPVLRTVDFSGYTGSGHYIAFRNILPSGTTGDYSCNFLDDIRLTLNASACAISSSDLPYTDNFDSYTTSTTPKTGVEPPCWTLAHQYVAMTDEYKPMVYYGSANAHSGSYSLLLNKRCIYAMPKYEGSVNTLQLQFYLTQSQTKYQLQVGVMSNLSDASTFVPVATLNNSGTGPVLRTVNFSGYTGSGRYIAFRNILPSGTTGDYSCNFLDDIRLTRATKNMAVTEVEGEDIDMPDVEGYLESIAVYPNPTTGVLHIDAVDVQKVECYNQMGQLVGVYDHADELNISALSNGVYMLRITVPQGVTVRKVVKK